MDDQNNPTPSMNAQNPTPPMSTMGSNTPQDTAPTPPEAPKNGSGGPVVAIIIIIALLILGGLYFWGAQLNQMTSEESLPLIPGDAMMEQDSNTASYSDSDSLNDLSAELEADNLDDFDAELEAALDNMDAELKASSQ
jgi:uncharacterized protein HemX